MSARSRAVAAGLALGLMAAPASACLNDRDTEATERLFRSQYPLPEPKSADPSSEEPAEPVMLAGGLFYSAAGLGLAALGVALAVPGDRKARG